ncbi:MAG: tRNA pseudouridine(38-40) synthase TruA [Thermomicrobiales bacterium]
MNALTPFGQNVPETAALKLVVSYDGAGFAGSQAQAGERTVQGVLERALAVLAGLPVKSVFAGRTDRGVHASGQVVSCVDVRPEDSDDRIMLALNGLLPYDIAVHAVRRERSSFHARFDAKWREYRYRIWVGPRQPLVHQQVWHRRSPLDVAQMNAGARQFIGKRDMASLASFGRGMPWADVPAGSRGTVRDVMRCACNRISPWWGEGIHTGELVEVQVAADGFLPRMVRTMVALIVEVGMGGKPAGWISDVLQRQDRRAALGAAPAHGLTLWQVGYV